MTIDDRPHSVERRRALILHSHVAEGGSNDEKDVLVQAQWVKGILEEMRCEVALAPFFPDLEGLRRMLNVCRPSFVFNLVETVEGRGRLIHLAPAFLDHLDIPYTGASADALYATSNKLVAKRLLQAEGLATPPWVAPAGSSKGPFSWKRPWLLKSVWEHASVGIDDASVVTPAHEAQLLDFIHDRARILSDEIFAETFIEGREFNLSLLASGKAVEVLPPAEMVFRNYPSGKWRIVGYQAKWDAESFEALHTERSFDFTPEDQALLGKMNRMALRCWSLFNLRGYARVDFRVDTSGSPWILEVNANPCLSPDAGFMAAAQKGGLSPQRVMERILGGLWHPVP